MFGSSIFNLFGWGNYYTPPPPPPPPPTTFQFTAFKGSDLVGGVKNYLSIGRTFVMPAVATSCLTVTDDDGKLSGDQKKNEKGDDKSKQTADIDYNGVQVQNDVKIYAEQYYILKGSDGKTYKLLEIEIKNVAQYGNDKVDYYSFIGDVPPAGVTLKTIGVKEVGSDGVKYSDLGAGPKDLDPTFGAGVLAGGATEVADNAVGENTVNHTASGVIAFTDKVGDTHTVDVVPDSGSYVGTMTASITDSATPDGVGQVTWNFSVNDADLDSLGEGETVEQNYDLILEDSGGNVGITTVKITLTGTNDVPVFGQVVEFAQDFDTDTAGVVSNGSTVTQVEGGPLGGDYAIVEGAGAFTRFDGYRADFPGTYVAEVKVYLDTTWANGQGFDYSVASSGSDGGHQRDFILHVTKDTSSNALLVGASNNTNFVPREDLDTLSNNYTVSSSGWYTIRHTFRDDGGQLEVDIQLVDSNGIVVFTETRTAAADTIGAGGEVGGNRYGWFTANNVTGGIAIDNLSLSVPDYQAPQINETSGVPAPAAELTATGDVPFTDVDLSDAHAASASFSSASLSTGGPVGAGLLAALGTAMSAAISNASTGDGAGTVTWNFALDADAAEELAQGQVLRAIYNLSVTDDESTSDTIQVEVTIVGSNDAPVIEGTSVIADSVSEPGDILGIDEAGLGGGLEPTFAVATDLSVLMTTPGDLNTVLAALTTELGGDTAKAIAVLWDYLDDNYAYYNAPVNEAFIRLGVKYVEYLQGGGSPFVDVTAKYTADGADAGTNPDRLQSMHDNLLGNLSSAAMGDRGFPPLLLADLTTLVSTTDPDLLTRAYYSGNEGASDAAARQFDLDNGCVPTATGTIVASDVDNGAILGFSGDATGTYGSFEIDPVTGAWTYTLDSDAADHLAQGDSDTDTFTVTVTDQHGATDTVQVTVTIDGTNDAPVIVSSSVTTGTTELDSLPGITEAGPGPTPLEPAPALLTPAVTAALATIPSNPSDLANILATVETEVGDLATAIAIVWDYIDDNYSYYNNAINEAGVRLALAYADYLQNGGTPLLNITAKYTADGGDAGTNPDREQSLHDNILGNIDIPSMQDKLLGGGQGGSNPSPQAGLYATLFGLVSAADLVGRPIYGGYEGTANNALAFDIGKGLVPMAGDLDATDVDDGAMLAWSGDDLTGAYGDFTLDANTGEWTYTADAAAVAALDSGESAVDSFVATVTDEHGATDSITVSVTVNGVNDAPVAADDAFQTDELTAISGDVFADNGSGADSDADGEAISVTAVNGSAVAVGTQITLPSGALLTLNADGTFDYDPNGAFDALNDGDSTTDSFEYTVSDGDATDTATVTIDIDGITFPPNIPAGQVWVFDENKALLAVYSTTPGTDANGNPIIVNAYPLAAAVEGPYAGVDHTVAAGAGSYSVGGSPIDIKFDGMKIYGNQWDVDPRDAAGLRTSGSADESMVDGTGTTQVFRVQADNVAINGFEIFGSSSDLIVTDGITGTGGDFGAVISYNIIRNAGDDGISIYKHTGAIVEYNRVYATNDGIEIRGSNGGLIAEGVATFDTIVRHNEVSGGFGNGGIYAYASQNTTITENYVHDYAGDSGIVMGTRRGFGNPFQDGGTVSNNVVENSGENGIDVFQSDVVVTGNTVTGNNGWAVSVGIDYNNETQASPKPDNVTIEDNVFENNNLVKNVPVLTGVGSTPDAGPVRVVNGSTNISFDNNEFTGNANANLLASSSGSEHLQGDAGADTFLFDLAHTSDGIFAEDIIEDYVDGEDFINLGGASVGSFDETVAGQVTLTLNGADFDKVVVVGVSAFADLDFVV